MTARALAAALAALVFAPAAYAAEAPAPTAIDKVFARFGPTTPGCAVGVESPGQAPVFRAYGQGDLEHPVANTPDTVFEAGSVSKQFTAAAILLLAQDGKLSLDDDVRKYLPELPDDGQKITLAELLGHTSGLRDWGSVEAIAGWPRTERVYGLDDVLRIMRRQKALNFAPGTRWSYTNTGFTLSAIIVQRVSGKSLAEFTRERLFTPLGMSHTQWRDDFRRVVPNRAVAYSHAAKGGWEQMMPFENTYGHGGLLTTVGDLLIWNRALSDGKLGKFVAAEFERPTPLSEGRTSGYGRGLFLGRRHGVAEVSHSGSTAGYRAWVARYPGLRLSIAMLCNAAEGDYVDLGHAVADIYLPPEPPSPKAAPEPAPLGLAGWWADDRDGSSIHLVVREGRLATEDGSAVTAGPSGRVSIWSMDGSLLPDGRLQFADTGDWHRFSRAAGYAPTPEDLARIAGRYRSDEAEVTYIVTAEPGGLRATVETRPDKSWLFRPAYKDAFSSSELNLRLVHSPDGAVTGLRISEGRVWDLRFDRLP